MSSIIVLSFVHCSFVQLKTSNNLLTARGTALPFSHKSVVSAMHEQNIICSKTQSTYLEAVIRRSSGGLSANEKEGKKYIELVCYCCVRASKEAQLLA